jgi:hypothetical protein
MPPLWFLQQLEDRKRRRDAAHASRSRPSTAPHPSPMARQAATKSARQAAGPSVGQYNVPTPVQRRNHTNSDTQTTTRPRRVANTGIPRTSQNAVVGSRQSITTGPGQNTAVATSQNATPSSHPPTTSSAGPSTTQTTQFQPPTRSKSKHKKVDSGAHVDFPIPSNTSSTTRPTYSITDSPHLDPVTDPFRDPSTTSESVRPEQPIADSVEPNDEKGPHKLEPFYKSMWKKLRERVYRKKERDGEGERPDEVHNDADLTYLRMNG